MDDLQTRHLRYFVAVAEELHFGRAAERLHVAQPSVSRAVSDLERVLGVQLLARTTRQVELTPAGVSFLADARSALQALRGAGRRAARAGAATPTLSVALKPDGDADLLEPALAGFQREAPGADAEIAFSVSGHAAMVRDGRADVALLPAPFDSAGLDHEEVLAEPRLAVLPATHPLAGVDSVPLDRAIAEPVVAWPEAGDALERFYMGRDPESLASLAVPPPPLPAGPEARELADCLRLVELGRAISFLPSSVARRYQRPSLAYRPVVGLSPLRLHLAWNTDSRSPLVAAFVRAVVDAAAARAASDTHPASFDAEADFLFSPRR